MAYSLIEYLNRKGMDNPLITLPFSTLICSIAEAGKTIAYWLSRSALSGMGGEADTQNVQGEQQKKLDVLSNELLIELAPRCARLAGIASEENETFIETAHHTPQYLLMFDPLDGSSNIDVNVTVGTIFSVYRKPDLSMPVSASDFLQPGVNQLCAGYIAYGPSTQMAITFGDGVDLLTLDRDSGDFYVSRTGVRIPEDAAEFAVNMSRTRHWFQGFKRYVDDLIEGDSGPRRKNYNMRWIGSMVADVNRILNRGGVFCYPADRKTPGRLRLMYEANPMAFLIEQAGGAATDGKNRILEIQPSSIHQRVGVMLGSKREIEHMVGYTCGDCPTITSVSESAARTTPA